MIAHLRHFARHLTYEAPDIGFVIGDKFLQFLGTAMLDLGVLQREALEVIAHTVEEQIVPFGRVALCQRLIFDPEHHLGIEATDRGWAIAAAGEDHPAQDFHLSRGDMLR